MERLSLQELIASRITSYIEGRGPRVSEWSLLEEECGILEAFRGPGLEKWFTVLRNGLQGPAWMLIKEILFQLQSTGIDHEDTLRLGWVQDNNAFKCLKIPCHGDNSWVIVRSCYVHPVRVDYNSRVQKDTVLEDGKEY